MTSVFDSEVKRLPNRLVSSRQDAEAFAFLKRGKPMLAFWLNGNKVEAPDGGLMSVGFPLTLIFYHKQAFEEPVWVDLLSGRVYAFPKQLIARDGNVSIISFLPSIDSPCLLTERSALDLQ